jgi:hypothetical protein
MSHHDDDTERRDPAIPFVTDYVSHDIPMADSFRVMRCSDTSHAHIVLFNEHDEPIAQFTVGPINVENITRACEGIFALPRLQ